MQDKLAEYEKVLRELSGRVGEADADIIRGVLERVTYLSTHQARHQC